jgi:cell division protein FtsB
MAIGLSMALVVFVVGATFAGVAASVMLRRTKSLARFSDLAALREEVDLLRDEVDRLREEVERLNDNGRVGPARNSGSDAIRRKPI